MKTGNCKAAHKAVWLTGKRPGRIIVAAARQAKHGMPRKTQNKSVEVRLMEDKEFQRNVDGIAKMVERYTGVKANPPTREELDELRRKMQNSSSGAPENGENSK